MFNVIVDFFTIEISVYLYLMFVLIFGICYNHYLWIKDEKTKCSFSSLFYFFQKCSFYFCQKLWQIPNFIQKNVKCFISCYAFFPCALSSINYSSPNVNKWCCILFKEKNLFVGPLVSLNIVDFWWCLSWVSKPV